MKSAALIVAAGRGTRAGGDQPKQWQPLAGKRVIDWTLDAFRAVPGIDLIVLVLHPDALDHPPRHEGGTPIEPIAGGPNRAASVRNGLEHLEGRNISHVLIHDVARPCLRPALIETLLEALQHHRAVAPALPVTDALWHGADGKVGAPRDRQGLFRAQTPQCFALADILAAHRAHPGEAADDVALARAAGIEVRIIEGDEDNLKITLPGDFRRASKILRGQMDIRTGSGYDVHRFGPGDQVTLCGVTLPHDRALQGHSDADVGLHALSDAIYGALAEGDIGQHFPPSDPQWKGAESHIFLRHAVDLAMEKGFSISNMDITLICETPKIGPHAQAMRDRLAGITGTASDRISVKATTSERLGFTGRGEGIAAQAIATLVRR